VIPAFLKNGFFQPVAEIEKEPSLFAPIEF
jgi:hypothetical protein